MPLTLKRCAGEVIDVLDEDNVELSSILVCQIDQGRAEAKVSVNRGASRWIRLWETIDVGHGARMRLTSVQSGYGGQACLTFEAPERLLILRHELIVRRRFNERRGARRFA